MIDYKGKYQKIVKEFIKKDFPSLKNEKINIKEKDAWYRAKADYFPWPFGMQITISEKLRRFPEKSIRRIILHEMCHLEIFLQWGVIKTNLNFLAYLMSSNIRNKTEAEANILMIKNGHWKEVMTARKGNIKRGLDYSLTEKEIIHYKKQFEKKIQKNK